MPTLKPSSRPVEWLPFGESFLNRQSRSAGHHWALVQLHGPAPEAQRGVSLEVGDRSFGVEDSVRHHGESFLDATQQRVQIVAEFLNLQ